MIPAKHRGIPSAKTISLKFAPINLVSFGELVEGLTKLYETGNLSRDSYADAFGYDIEEEFRLKKEEKATMKKMGLDEFPQQPFSPPPNQGGNQPQNKPKPTEKQ